MFDVGQRRPADVNRRELTIRLRGAGRAEWRRLFSLLFTADLQQEVRSLCCTATPAPDRQQRHDAL
jgi:hypothetical protein